MDSLPGGQAVAKVIFSLDHGAVIRTEKASPFDFNGSFDVKQAYSFNLNTLSNGQHTMAVSFYTSVNLYLVVTISFTTMNPMAPIVANVPLVYSWLNPATVSPAPIIDRNGQSVGLFVCQRKDENIYVGLMPSLLLVGEGVLSIQTTTGRNYGAVNAQKNAIGLAVPPVDSGFEISLAFHLPAFTNNNDEVALWMGNDVDNFAALRFTRQSATTTTAIYSVEVLVELFAVASTIASLSVQTDVSTLSLADVVELHMKFNVSRRLSILFYFFFFFFFLLFRCSHYLRGLYLA